jgi:hypothetical protein
MPHIFISYSRADRSTTEKLTGLLNQTYDHVWYDKKLTSGDEWWEEILKQIALCDHFIYLISKEALESEYCLKELAEAQRLKKHIVPVVIRTCDEIPKELTKLQIISMTNGIDLEGLNQLYKALIRASKDGTSIGLHEQQRAADMKLLKQLWPLVSSQNIARLDNETQKHYIDNDFYNHMILRYLHLRDPYQNPEHRFFDPVLEEAFTTFDAALTAYDKQMFQAYTLEIRGSRDVIMSDYKYVTAGEGRRGATLEIINHKLEEYGKTVDAILEVRRYHRELVAAIRTVFPDFDFSEDEGRNSET